MEGEELVVKSTTDALTKFDNFDSVEEQIKYADFLITSRLIPFKKPEEAVMAFNIGRALGLDPAVTAMNVYPIEGRLSLSVHLATALAKRTGIIDWSIEKDYEPVYDNEGKYIDVETSIRFYRYNEKMNKTIENLIRYKWSDAVNAGYTTRNNWLRMPKNMLRARCLMEGIRFVGPDTLIGLFYEGTEIIDNIKGNSGFNIELDQDGNPVLQAK
jgi:hypothetical protein